MRINPLRFVRELYAHINDDNVFNGAAALAYYLTLSLFPALIFLMAMIAYLPIGDVDRAIMDVIDETLPESAAVMVGDVVGQVTAERRGGLLSFGALAALWAASTGMYAVMQQLNITYRVKEARSFIRARLLALALTLLFGMLVVGGFSLIVAGGWIQQWLEVQLGAGQPLLYAFAALRWAIIVLGLLLAFALIYYLGPDVRQQFRFISPGSVLGGLLLIAASVGFSFYANRFGNYDATYGSIGAVIILMLWLYLAGLVILLGSEINVLVETYSDTGKVRGEKAEGENPAAERRVEQKKAADSAQGSAWRGNQERPAFGAGGAAHAAAQEERPGGRNEMR